MKLITCDICGVDVATKYPYGRTILEHDNYSMGFIRSTKKDFDICPVCNGKMLDGLNKIIEEIKNTK